VAVHSLKDLPTFAVANLTLGAVPPRGPTGDALVSSRHCCFGKLPTGAVVATSSLRRRAQLLRARPDLQIRDVRGNVDTRLAKLDRSRDWAAVVLAAAGLIRLGLEARISERLALDVMLPAPGQGALAATVRAADPVAREAVRRAFHDPDVELAAGAERGFLRRLEGGCQVPVAALAVVARDGASTVVRLRGRVVSLGGEAVAEGVRAGPARALAEAEELGAGLADQLLGEGADAILRSVREAGAEPVPEP
jgi:hydroxymethylbilane synthase